jgi:hypothetical protein
MSLNVTVTTNAGHLADLKITRVLDGADGTHTYDWEWGIQHAGAYHQMGDGTVQHRESDGAFTLIAKVLERIRGRKADQ